jgi:riboflavin synthase
VVELKDNSYSVTAIGETVQNESWKLGRWQLEPRESHEVGDRLDGHMVQGHVDQTGTCIEAQETNGMVLYFEYDEALNNLTIEKVQLLSTE